MVEGPSLVKTVNDIGPVDESVLVGDGVGYPTPLALRRAAHFLVVVSFPLARAT
jgi:hypothetical protein